MTLAAGSRLGPYEVLSAIGAGGMGEVYKARDTRLDRTVAVKVLPEHLTSHEELRQRFEREAKTISQLSHPHICALYDVGREGDADYLVMEYLEGETLASRLNKGALPSEQLLRYGIEIADALDKAHRQGIVHRDLKPGNVMLTKSGVKLLDFGLAKLQAEAREEALSGVSHLATKAQTSTPLTERGTVLGTFQYMAPEQLEGGSADARSDIFAFGAVLYEMATGKKAFSGKSQASLIGAILRDDPPSVNEVAPTTPPALNRVIKTCLAKDPEDRFQTAHDVRLQLQWIAEGGSQAGVPATTAARRKPREIVAWTIAVASLLAALALAAVAGRRPAAETRVIRLALESPAKAPFDFFDHAVVSPDGRLVAFVAHAASGKQSLWVRPLDSLSASPVAGTEGASALFWSPNSGSIGFFAEGKLKRVEAAGGPPQVLASAPSPSGGSWSPSGDILFAPQQFGPLLRIASTGGAVKPATKLGPGEDTHIWPSFLPDGKHFVFLGDASSTQDHSIRLGSLDSLETRKLIPAAVTSLGFASPDWLLFVRAGTLLAQRLDVKARKMLGDPAPLGEQIAPIGLLHEFEFSASQTGVLLYRSANPERQLVWLDRAGKRLGNVGEPARYARLELSPDDRFVAFERLDSDLRHGNLWRMDLSRGSVSRLTATASSDYTPVWSPDGRSILFASARSGVADIYAISAGGGSSEKLVLHDAQDKNVLSFSPDGKFALLTVVSPSTREDIWMLPLSGTGKAAPLVATQFTEVEAQVSPDGRWFAYSSDESGRFEVYVQSFADAASRARVSTSGGARPRWRADGKELFFLAGDVLQSVGIGPASPEAGAPKDLFRLPVWADYTVARDGQRVLAAISVEENPYLPATIVLNWTAALKK